MLKLKMVVLPLAIAGLLAGCSTTYQPSAPVAYSGYSAYPGHTRAAYVGQSDTYGYYYGNVFVPAVYTPVESQSGGVPH